MLFLLLYWFYPSFRHHCREEMPFVSVKKPASVAARASTAQSQKNNKQNSHPYFHLSTSFGIESMTAVFT